MFGLTWGEKRDNMYVTDSGAGDEGMKDFWDTYMLGRLFFPQYENYSEGGGGGKGGDR